jgi:hypothetical protein
VATVVPSYSMANFPFDAIAGPIAVGSSVPYQEMEAAAREVALDYCP